MISAAVFRSCLARVQTALQSTRHRVSHFLHAYIPPDNLGAYQAAALSVRDNLLVNWNETALQYTRKAPKRAYYLSLEFLMGRLFSNSLYNAGIYDQTAQAIGELGMDIDELRGEEYDMGLGNGGLGRLAACFLDSLATLDYPAVGYGIHYEFGLFRQEFSKGHQIELPDDWMRFGTPWEIVRPELTQTIQLFGHVENVFDDKGNYVPR